MSIISFCVFVSNDGRKKKFTAKDDGRRSDEACFWEVAGRRAVSIGAAEGTHLGTQTSAGGQIS
jgi:hypothetical protein